MDCPFCNINKEKTRIIKETKNSFVILSNPKLVPGHILVIPKRHVERLFELNELERNDILNLLIKYQEKILKNVSSGCDIRQNYRPFQKQGKIKVNHLHIHLQPRELEDELYKKCQIFEKEIFKELESGEMEKFSKMLKE